MVPQPALPASLGGEWSLGGGDSQEEGAQEETGAGWPKVRGWGLSEALLGEDGVPQARPMLLRYAELRSLQSHPRSAGVIPLAWNSKKSKLPVTAVVKSVEPLTLSSK